MIVIQATFEAFDGEQDKFVTLTRKTTIASRRERGCVLYQFTSDIEHPHRFSLFEIWESEEDLRTHFRGQAFKSFFAELPAIGKPLNHLAFQGPLNSYVPPNANG